jgi:uncharacterized protein involved in exopolysaccharide biosynthesis
MDPDQLFADVSLRLRECHARVAALDLPAAQKASITRRLLAISDSAKHDLTRASQRLDAFVAELEVQHPSP